MYNNYISRTTTLNANVIYPNTNPKPNPIPNRNPITNYKQLVNINSNQKLSK